ncbi:hypothetical protein BH11MYX3_BH11MYX3_27540 [soil metagenome]
MNKLLLVCVVVGGLVTGCTKKRVAECDEFVATIDKIAKCDKLPTESRKAIQESGQTIKDALKLIDDSGGVGDAPQDLVQQMRDTCKTQNTTVVDQYMKLMPECMK